MATIEDFKMRFSTQGTEKIKQTSEDINNLKDDIAELGQIGGPFGNTINGIIGRLGVLGASAAALGVAFVGLGTYALTTATELQNIANASGIAASQLKDLQASVIAAGGSADFFGDIATDLNKNLQDAAAGNKDLQDAFRTLGVFVTDSNGKVRNTGDVLSDLVARFRSGKLSVEEYNAALKLLGEEAKKLDLSKLSASRDAVTDAEIQKLKEYSLAIDRVKAAASAQVISFFGQLALDIDAAIKKNKELEEELAKQDRKRLFGAAPDVIGAATGLGGLKESLGITTPPITRGMTDAEKKAYQDRINLEKSLAEAYGDRDRELRSLSGRMPAQGGFGAADPKDTERAAKEAADRELRIYRSLNTEKKNILLQFSKDEEDAINIRAQAQIDENRRTITDKTELAAKIKEIESQRDLEIFNYRKQLAEKQAQEELRLAELVARSRGVVEEQERLNTVLAERNRFINENLTATDSERRRAEELFDLEQERLRVLKEISQIKDLPPTERAAREKEINAAFEKRRGLVEAQQAADKKASESFSKGFEKAYRQYAEDAQNNFEHAQRVFETTTRGMEDAIVGFAKTGKFEWKGFVSSILEELLRAQIQSTIASIFGPLLGGKGSSGSGGGSMIVSGVKALGSLLGFADGGVIPTNKPVIVGERGPEILTGAAGRSVIPNEQAFGSTQVTYNINAVDAQSFKQMIAADPTFLYAVSEQGRRRLPGAR